MKLTVYWSPLPLNVAGTAAIGAPPGKSVTEKLYEVWPKTETSR